MTDRELLPSEIRYGSGGAIEEIFNSITHAIGAGLSIAGLVVLLVLTGNNPSPWKYVAFSVYGASQILLYLSSAIMHGFAALPRARRALDKIDHASIFILIAGTYTPLCLVAMRASWGWAVFGIIWGLAIVGVVLKTMAKKKNRLIDLLYVPMGWMIVIAFRPVLQSTTTPFLVWAIIGRVCYTVGFIFYAWRRLPFSHVVWHLFVIGGSLSFFMAYAFHLA